MNHKQVLIVDDDVDIRDALCDVLKDEGYSVEAVADGLQALEHLRSHSRPCLIILDWMMPRCDGPQFRNQQKEDPTIANIPVVLLTADARLAEKSSQLDAKE